MGWTWRDVIFFLIVCLIFAFDLLLAGTGHLTISLATWLAERAHPILILGVAMVGVTAAYYSWNNMPVAMSLLIAVGHLCTSEGAGVALKSATRWLGG